MVEGDALVTDARASGGRAHRPTHRAGALGGNEPAVPDGPAVAGSNGGGGGRHHGNDVIEGSTTDAVIVTRSALAR